MPFTTPTSAASCCTRGSVFHLAVGYLTDEFFRLARRLVAEAARLGMKVILYDEGSYLSGSAQGAVVAENPQYASQAMALWQHTVEGPFAGFWRPNTGRALLDRHVCTVIGRHAPGGAIDPRSVRVLNALPHDIVRLEVPAGRWTAMSVWNTASGGHIRGVFPEEESGSVSAPPAGDILNPDAVACFMRLTHDRYYRHLQEFFGSTIIAMFTDEPQLMGRYPLRPIDPKPYTPGLVDWLAERWGEAPPPALAAGTVARLRSRHRRLSPQVPRRNPAAAHGSASCPSSVRPAVARSPALIMDQETHIIIMVFALERKVHEPELADDRSAIP